MRTAKSLVLASALLISGTLGLTGCGDSNADNSPKLPPPTDIQGGKTSPQEAAAAAHAERKGAHFQEMQKESGGAPAGEQGDGR